MSFLSFLDTIETIPPELKRSFELITHLDQRCKEVMDKINQCVASHKLANSKQKRDELENETKALFDKLDGLATDKFNTVDIAYDLIDKNITRLVSLADDVPLDMPTSASEPTYCICHQVSHGEMIACDNKECHIEWFHMTCMGLTKVPKTKWFCGLCTMPKNKRKLSKR